MPHYVAQLILHLNCTYLFNRWFLICSSILWLQHAIPYTLCICWQKWTQLYLKNHLNQRIKSNKQSANTNLVWKQSTLTGKKLFSLQRTLFLQQGSCFHCSDNPAKPCTSLYGIAVNFRVSAKLTLVLRYESSKHLLNVTFDHKARYISLNFLVP